VDSTLLCLRAWLSLRGKAHTTRERSLEAMEPFPGLAGAKSSKEGKTTPDTVTPTPYRRDAIHYKSHPAPRPITRRAVCTKVDTASGGKSTRSLRGRERALPSPIRTTRPSGRGQIASSLGRRSLVTKWLAPAKTQQGDTHARNTPRYPHLSPSPEYHP
jgi:hypothetical protein